MATTVKSTKFHVNRFMTNLSFFVEKKAANIAMWPKFTPQTPVP